VAHVSKHWPQEKCIYDHYSPPEAASKREKGVRIQWRGTPIPRVEAYRYLGVMLHENCRWDCHLAHAREKGAKATYAMAYVLHNRRIHLAVRRIVLQACVRPVVASMPLQYGMAPKLT
jgi:hypothetical protein